MQRLARVRDIAEQIRGVTYTKGEARTSPSAGHVALLRAGNITDQGVRLEDLIYVPESRVADKQRLKVHDVLVAASSGSLDVVGKAAQVTRPADATFGAFCKVLRPSNEVEPRYFAHFFGTASYRRRISGLAAGANINNLRNEHLDDLEIPLPPKEEQRRIADILDRADALRAKRRRALALLDDLTQSIFLDMFGDPDQNPRGWPIRSLAELVAQNDRINYGVLQPGGEFPGGVGLVRVGDLINGGIQHSSLKHIDPAVERSYKRSRLVGNEVLVSCVGSIGVVAVASQDDVGLNIARAVSRVPIESPSMREYVAAHLRTPAVQRYFTRELRTVAQPTLNVKQLSETRIMQPPVKAIEKFVVAGETLAPCRSSISASADHLDIMFESLQQRAFVGEL